MNNQSHQEEFCRCALGAARNSISRTRLDVGSAIDVASFDLRLLPDRPRALSAQLGQTKFHLMGDGCARCMMGQIIGFMTSNGQVTTVPRQPDADFKTLNIRPGMTVHERTEGIDEREQWFVEATYTASRVRFSIVSDR